MNYTLLLIALGGVISYRVGVTNMTLEGIANIGAFAGALASYFGGSFTNNFYFVDCITY